MTYLATKKKKKLTTKKVIWGWTKSGFQNTDHKFSFVTIVFCQITKKKEKNNNSALNSTMAN